MTNRILWPSEKSSPRHLNLPVFHHSFTTVLCKAEKKNKKLQPLCVFYLACRDQHFSVVRKPVTYNTKDSVDQKILVYFSPCKCGADFQKAALVVRLNEFCA